MTLALPPGREEGGRAGGAAGGAASIGRRWIVHARSTTILAQRDLIDDGIAHLRDDVMPILMRTDGCIGLSMLVDRESCRCIATSAWQTEEAMRASEEAIRPVRERAAELFGGGKPEVQEWEIAVLHRDHTSGPGACARATWVRFEPSKADRVLDIYKMAVLPRVQEFDGFCSASLLLDRQNGLAVGTVGFDSLSGLERSREQAQRTRTEATREMGAEVVEVGEFELAIAHLRVPEMA
jgi:hypothetical protein